MLRKHKKTIFVRCGGVCILLLVLPDILHPLPQPPVLLLLLLSDISDIRSQWIIAVIPDIGSPVQ